MFVPSVARPRTEANEALCGCHSCLALDLRLLKQDIHCLKMSFCLRPLRYRSTHGCRLGGKSGHFRLSRITHDPLLVEGAGEVGVGPLDDSPVQAVVFVLATDASRELDPVQAAPGIVGIDDLR